MILDLGVAFDRRRRHDFDAEFELPARARERRAIARGGAGRNPALNVTNRSYQCSLVLKNFAKTASFAGENAWVAWVAAF